MNLASDADRLIFVLPDRSRIFEPSRFVVMPNGNTSQNLTPNKTPEPTPIGAGSPLSRATVTGAAWLSFFR